MHKDFCFIVFSHTGSDEKEEILTRCLSGIKRLKIPVIVASHLPISKENQDLCDYFIKDSDNLIVSEDQIFNNPVEIETPLYYVHDNFGGRVFSTHLFKKTYQPGVFNLYINSFNVAKRLGFKNAILWEFDFSIGTKSEEFLVRSMQQFKEDGLDFYCFQSFIQDLPCMHAIPSLLNIEMITSLMPSVPIQDPNEYSSVSKMMIMEQWTWHHTQKISARGSWLDYGKIESFMPDLIKGEVHSQRDNYLFFGLRSGLYFSQSSNEIIFYGSNGSWTNLKTQMVIKDSRGNIIYNSAKNLGCQNWFYEGLPSEIWDLAQTDAGIYVNEFLTNTDSGRSDSFSYKINSKNFGFISQLKKWKHA